MKRLSTLLLCICTFWASAQEYPFQNPSLGDEERLDNLISLMTLDEKINCMSTRPEIPRLGVKKHRIIEGLHGVALSGPANWAVKGDGAAPTTTFPQAYGLAQMWDPDLLQQIASWEADECRYLTQSPKYASGGLIMLAPNADLGRDIRWGRTEECYGEDAFLTAKLTVAFVKGLQGDDPKYWKTASLMKHFLANSNENNRYTNSSDFDDRLFREYYSYPFYKGITEGGSRAYMAAYNKYNGIPCTVHPMLEDITVKEWGQNGIIATDGGAYRRLVTAHEYYPNLEIAAAECIKSGITMFLDDYKEPLKSAVTQGMLKEKDIDEALRGSLRVMLKLGLFDNSDKNPYAKIGITDETEPWTKKEVHELVRKATAKSVVLLKNEEEMLPINKEEIKSIAVIGPSANRVVSDWYSGTPPYAVSVLEGIKNAVGEDVEVFFAESNKADSAVTTASKADLAIVCVGNHPLSYYLGWGENFVASDGREEVDREAISLEQEDLVKLVKAANPNTVLVLVSSFPYAINWSKEHVPAIVHITQSSQELGNGLADVLFGKVSPAGRLVQTWSASIDHLLPILEYDIRKGRTYMYDEHEPLFPFGFGLTYTKFDYKNLSLDKKKLKDGGVVNVTFELENKGDFDSDEVAQLYVSFPKSEVERPAKALKGFKRVFVKKGETVEVSIPLAAEDLKYWSVEEHAFVLEEGKVSFFVGTSSAESKLKGEVDVR
ncbi:glycoside hydrolase family 3 C-terminal domain-containing protein [Flammeovirgaceae bacterium SG7u.111]|nr:glycoside hydrolase family 3 C-terminal domain-containing protein [Flammeovirgaceae bacterium SG7u.132]WPO36541.1 glycoside hydrolase family 3 C-terminal domain-containing protein [Flammeovirgaceae bacterium SG7u.111]